LLLGSILGAMLLGVAVLASGWHVVPRAGQRVLSQVMAMAVGRTWAAILRISEDDRSPGDRTRTSRPEDARTRQNGEGFNRQPPSADGR